MASQEPDEANGSEYVITIDEGVHPDFVDLVKALVAELQLPDRITRVESESEGQRQYGCKIRFEGGACLHFHRKEPDSRSVRRPGLSNVKYERPNRPGPLIRADTREAIRRASQSPQVKISSDGQFLRKLDELPVRPDESDDHSATAPIEDPNGVCVAAPELGGITRQPTPETPRTPNPSSPHAGGAGPFDHEPLGSPIGVARVRLGAGIRGMGEGGPSGWSQEIGRRSEEQVFQKLQADLATYYGLVPSPVVSNPFAVAFLVGDPPPTLIWLNGGQEGGQSWDLEERDATGGIIRRHEVKSPNGELTPSEYAVWESDPSSYLVWRVDRDGQIKRAPVTPRRGTDDSIASRSLASDGSVASHGSGGRAFAWRRVHEKSGLVGLEIGTSVAATLRELTNTGGHLFPLRYRGNRVWIVHLDDQTAARLPGNPDGLLLAARSRNGLELMFAAAADLQTQANIGSRRPTLLILDRATGSIGLSRCIAEAVRSTGSHDAPSNRQA